MKRHFFLLPFLLLAFLSCDKNNDLHQQSTQSEITTNQSNNVAIPFSDGKTKAIGYNIITYVGHSGTNCSGCVSVGGVKKHVDCTGTGSACVAAFNLAISAGDYYFQKKSSKVKGTFNATTIDSLLLTGGAVFLVPARSLFIMDNSEEPQWLNIPEQQLERDEETGQFIFTGLFYSGEPAYRNE